ncbi:C1 family peptidase [Frateuria sp. GZRe12]|uniref:C1 family peptidase n=1 Tax=Frateuria sp. GZRe12 TaxID=3351533 RepID=UPI003EDBBFE5
MTIGIVSTVEQYFGRARDQGDRPTCLAFAVSDINRHYAPAPGFLSPEYLYRAALLDGNRYGGQGLSLESGLCSAASGQPEESYAPYQTNEPTSPIALPTLLPGTILYRSALSPWPLDFTTLVTALHARQPVGLGLRLTRSFYTPQDDVIAYEAETLPYSGHAVIAVGLGERAGTHYVRIRNSWGLDWGDNGHAWLPKNYVTDHTFCIFGASAWQP